MEDTAKAISVENKWLFFEVDASDIMLKFMNGKNDKDSVPVEKIFQQAAMESSDQRSPYIVLIKNAEIIMSDSNTKDGQQIIDKMRAWMIAELDKYASTKHEF